MALEGKENIQSFMNYMNELTPSASLAELLILFGICIPKLEGSVVLTISMSHGVEPWTQFNT